MILIERLMLVGVGEFDCGKVGMSWLFLFSKRVFVRDVEV